MAVALTVYEASITEHGIPAAIAYDDERGTWLEVEPFVDYAAAAVEQWQKENPNADPGTRVRVVDTYKGD